MSGSGAEAGGVTLSLTVTKIALTGLTVYHILLTYATTVQPTPPQSVETLRDPRSVIFSRVPVTAL